MGELCTSCLVEGRLLHGVREDGDDADQLYRQILDEVEYTEGPLSASMSANICWECRGTLRRFMRFKRQAWSAHKTLAAINGQGGDVTSVSRPPRLRVHLVEQFAYLPQDALPNYTEVKLEPVPPDLKPEVTPEAVALPAAEPEVLDHVEPASFACSLLLEEEAWQEGEGEGEDLGDAGEDALAHELPPLETTKRKTRATAKKTSTVREIKAQKTSSKKNKMMTPRSKKKTVSKSNMSKNKDVASKASKDDASEGVQVTKATERSVKSDVKKDKENVPKEKSKPLAERPICVECNKQFSSRKTYRYHINVLHKGQNRYPCPHCGKVYQWKSNLWRHIKNHKAVASGELYCAPCDRSFSSVATLRQHLRTSRNHVREADFSFMCTTCGARFVSAARLRDHVDWEHLHRAKHRCSHCDKAFKSGTSLSAHAKTVHARATRLLCHVCGQRYQSSAKLKYHISAMHTRAFPYACQLCGAVFRWYSSLYRHARQLHDKIKHPKKSRGRQSVPTDNNDTQQAETREDSYRARAPVLGPPESGLSRCLTIPPVEPCKPALELSVNATEWPNNTTEHVAT